MSLVSYVYSYQFQSAVFQEQLECDLKEKGHPILSGKKCPKYQGALLREGLCKITVWMPGKIVQDLDLKLLYLWHDKLITCSSILMLILTMCFVVVP